MTTKFKNSCYYVVTLEWNFKIEFYILEKEGRICEANGELKPFDEVPDFLQTLKGVSDEYPR